MSAQALRIVGAAARPVPPPRPVGPDDLAGVAARWASAGERWRPYVRHDLHRRWYVRLAWTPDHEVWLLCWELGQAIDLHDHGRSAGAFVVTEGVLREEYVSDTALRQIRLRPGVVRKFAAGHVHTVWNPGPCAATSIHAYSPPLHSMTFYARDVEDGLRATHVELVPKTALP
jgi:Cysteine dioxygenase type I